MAAPNLSICVVAKRTGCSVPTIRYYEDIGLLPNADRTDGCRRNFSEATIARLTFIRRCRDFGFSIDQVRELVCLVDEPTRPCVEVRDLAAKHLAEVQRRLLELQALESSLGAFVRACDRDCAGGPYARLFHFGGSVSSGRGRAEPKLRLLWYLKQGSCRPDVQILA